MFSSDSAMDTASVESPHPISGEGRINDGRKSHLLDIVAVPGGISVIADGPLPVSCLVYETFVLRLVEGQLRERKKNSEARPLSEKDRPGR